MDKKMVVEFQPMPVSDLDVAFPTRSMDSFLPPWDVIPAEFKRDNGPFVRIVDRWFYRGLDASKFETKNGIDAKTAWRHLKVCMGSFTSKHEHKIAGVAYLMSLWFVDPPVAQEE